MADAKPRDLHIPAAVLAHAELSLLACAVLAEVLDLYSFRGDVFAKDDYFGKRCHVAPRTVRDAIFELEKKGFLIRVVNHKAALKRRLTPTDKWQNPPLLPADSATTIPEVVAESAGSSGEIRQDFGQNPPGLPADSANINTSLNTNANTIQTNTQKKEGECVLEDDSLRLSAEKDTAPNPVAPAPSPALILPSFEEFWQAFGKKEDKYKCQQRWGALKPDEQGAAIAAVAAYVLATPEKRYRKNPLTWLNGKCWLDEDTPPPVGSLHTYSSGTAPTPVRARTNPSKPQNVN